MILQMVRFKHRFPKAVSFSSKVTNKIGGFSLIELVVVLVLMAILSAYIAPSLSDNTFQNRFFLDEAVNAIRYGQKLAVTTGCDVQVAMPSSNQITLQQRQNCTSGNFNVDIFRPGRVRTASESAVGYAINAPSNVVIASIDMPFHFDGLGQAFNSGGARITQAALSVGNRSIIVVGQTGYVYVPNI